MSVFHRQRRPAAEIAARRVKVRRATALGAMLATVGGLVALRSIVAPATGGALAAPGLAKPVAPSGASSSSASASRTPGAAKHHHHAGAAAPVAKAHHHGAVSSTVTGAAYDVGYGLVQVKVTVKGGKILDVTAVSLPQGGRSSDISNYAGPRLRQEALQKQNAHIDTVSGASYTSAGYAQSLQSALDKAPS